MTKLLSIMCILGLLASCGHSKGDRAVSGAGIGAGVGAAGAALMGKNALTGAAIGAAAGAITGAVTEEEQIDLGKPVWK